MEETKELTLPEQARDQAKNYFRQGMNCTECVMQSFLDIHGSDLPPEVIALATVFGGGMGHTKNTCGAIPGGVMALSAVVGRKHPLAKESMAERIAELNEIYDIPAEWYTKWKKNSVHSSAKSCPILTGISKGNHGRKIVCR